MTAVTLRFPEDRLATFTCSFGAADAAWYEVVGTKGSIRLEHAFEYTQAMSLETTIDGRTQRKNYPKHDQFAAELEYFSDCVSRRRNPEPSGLEGLLDVQIIDAIHRSAKTRRPIRLQLSKADPRPKIGQTIRKPPQRKAPPKIKVKAPHDP